MTPARHDAASAEMDGPAFSFVQALAGELSSGKVNLPGFPDVAMRVQRVLSDENVSVERVVRVIGSEPVLASRLLQVANSAALNANGRPVVDLKTAVTRVGLTMVRSATIAFAVRQLRASSALKGIEKPLGLLWEKSVCAASLSYVAARRLSQINPDTALLAGLLLNVGRLYILTRASRHRTLFSDVAAYQAIERDWHLSIATAVLENWEIADEIVESVRDSEDLDREPRGVPCLTDLLLVANLLGAYRDQPDLLEMQLRSVKPLARLQLTRDTCASLVEESQVELAALRSALS